MNVLLKDFDCLITWLSYSTDLGHEWWWKYLKASGPALKTRSSFIWPWFTWQLIGSSLLIYRLPANVTVEKDVLIPNGLSCCIYRNICFVLLFLSGRVYGPQGRHYWVNGNVAEKKCNCNMSDSPSFTQPSFYSHKIVVYTEVHFCSNLLETVCFVGSSY